MSLFIQYLLTPYSWFIVVSLIIGFGIVHYFENKRFTKKSTVIQQELNAVFDGSDADAEDDSNFTASLEVSRHIEYKGATKFLEGGSQQFYEIMNDRRSIRKFSSKSIPFETIENCIQAAGTSPSGAHTEPWTFCVVSDPSLKSNIREIIEAEERINYDQRMSKQWTIDLRPFKTNHIKEYLTIAPYLILVFKQIYGTRSDGKRKQHYYNEISTSIAVGILISALQAAGISSLVTTPLNCGPALRCLLERPSNEKLVVLLPVGYPAEDCLVPDLRRKDISEILIRY